LRRFEETTRGRMDGPRKSGEEDEAVAAAAAAAASVGARAQVGGAIRQAKFAAAADSADEELPACSTRGCRRGAAVRILPSRNGGEEEEDGGGDRRLCLLHYYACGDARRAPLPLVQMLEPRTGLQRPAVQAAFAQVFVDLQDEISRGAASGIGAGRGEEKSGGGPGRRDHGARDDDDDDPLSVLDRIHGSRRSSTNSRAKSRHNAKTKKKPPPPPPPSSRPGPNGDAERREGGYWTEAAVPERIVLAQRKEMERYRAMDDRVRRAGTGSVSGASATAAGAVPQPRAASAYPLKRKRPSRKLIWNAVLEQEERERKKAAPPFLSASFDAAQAAGRDVEPSSSSAAAVGAAARIGASILPREGGGSPEAPAAARCPGCGGTRAELVGTRGGSRAAASQTKGEVWGNKEAADESWSRYRCPGCGRVWTEDD
jgi:hypothetical protein